MQSTYLGSDEPLLLLDVEPPLQPPGQGQEEEEEAGRAEEGGHRAAWVICNTPLKCYESARQTSNSSIYLGPTKIPDLRQVRFRR